MKKSLFSVLCLGVLCCSEMAFARPSVIPRQENIIRAMVEARMQKSQCTPYTDQEIEQGGRLAVKVAGNGLRDRLYENQLKEKFDIDGHGVISEALDISYATVDSFCKEYDTACRTDVADQRRLDAHKPKNWDEPDALRKWNAQITAIRNAGGKVPAEYTLTPRQENILRAVVARNMESRNIACTQYTDQEIEQTVQQVIRLAKVGIRNPEARPIRFYNDALGSERDWIVISSFIYVLTTVDSFCVQYDDTCRDIVMNDRHTVPPMLKNQDEKALNKKLMEHLKEQGVSEKEFQWRG